MSMSDWAFWLAVTLAVTVSLVPRSTLLELTLPCEVHVTDAGEVVGVAVGGTDVGVAVGGTRVGVGVAVGGTRVGVAVGGTGVAVAVGVAVGGAPVSRGPRSV